MRRSKFPYREFHIWAEGALTAALIIGAYGFVCWLLLSVGGPH